MRKVLVFIGIIILVVLIAVPLVGGIPVTGQGTAGSGNGPSGTQANIRKIVVGRGDIQLTVSATGNVVPIRQSNLTFDQSGRVTEVLVEQDQPVQAGQVLARVDNSAEAANLAQAENNLKAADASLQKLLEPVDPGQLAIAQANVKSAEASYSAQAGGTTPQQINNLQLQYQKAAQAAQDAEKLRIEAGGRTNGPGDPNYDKYVAQAGQAQVNAAIVQLNLQKAKAGTSLTQATAGIAYQQALLAQLKAGPKQSDIDAAQAAEVVAKLQRDQAQHQLDQTNLLAPYAGIMSTISVKPGMASSGVAMVISDISTLYIDTTVDETDIGKIQIGQPVQITLNALPNVNLTGKVLRITQTADTTASVITYVVRIALDKTDVPVKVGMSANATFIMSQAQNVLRVPNNYLRVNTTTGQTTVFLVNTDGTLVQVPVTTGLQGSDYTEIASGLYEGETIALVTSTTGGSVGGNGGNANGGNGGSANGGGNPSAGANQNAAGGN
jgi:HlyD family secretion protein